MTEENFRKLVVIVRDLVYMTYQVADLEQKAVFQDHLSALEDMIGEGVPGA